MSTEFGSNLDERKERSQSKFRKTEFLKLDEGEHTVRILDSTEIKHYTHYIGFAYVKCLGDNCPICLNNKKILFEHPEDYRDVKGWNPRRDRYYINVLDKTAGKICPKCETEASANSDLCPACGTVLGVAGQLNKIKVLTGSRGLFEDLKVLYKTVRNEQDEIVDIRHYDWILVTRGKKFEKTTSLRPNYLPHKAGLPEFNAENLFDLNTTVIQLNPEEMLDVFNGTSLKDIFAMRRTAKQSALVDEKANAEVSEEIRNLVGSIFPE